MPYRKYNIDEIAELLGQNANSVNHGFNGAPTIWDQYRNADMMLDKLNSIGDLDPKSREYQNFANQFKGEKGNSVISGALTGISGATNILSNAVRDSQIADTSVYEGQIADRRNYGNYNYGSYSQLANDMANQPMMSSYSFEDIRGMNTGQKIGSVATSALSGATTGFQIGGPWGAAIGGAAGLLGGIGGVITGDKRAKAEQAYLASSTAQANAISNLNLQAAHERISDNESRYKMSHVVAHGGKIERKRESIQDFASRVLRAPKNQVRTRPAEMVRTYEDGGVRIRIKK